MTGLSLRFRRTWSGAFGFIFAACTLSTLLLTPEPLAGQNDYFFPEGFAFDTDIPSPEAYFGYPIGTYFTRQDRIVAYLQELARLSDRATYQSIGTTFEYRDMPVLTVTSPENHARLEEIRQAHLASLEPGSPPAPDLPAIAHLGYNVHGNEASAGEAALLTAYWLVAGTGPEVEGYLDEAVFHVEPTLNPDGRDRWANWANINRARPPVADPLDREHNEAWPGGRTNHYWFDLNRDWFLLVNPESHARVDFHHRWRANVVTDHHEMGTSSSFFFEPTKPVGSWNPLLPNRLYTDVTETFAEYWAEALDDIGSLYFSEEVFDKFYPGYGSSYPSFLGGLAVLFEQASSRGLVQESTHHGKLTFAFTVRNQLRAALATIRATVENREMLREYQRDFYATALSEG
ncbi:M14 family zinc carboxypeptidase, partial [Gemmatimonadota bacterium]